MTQSMVLKNWMIVSTADKGLAGRGTAAVRPSDTVAEEEFAWP